MSRRRTLGTLVAAAAAVVALTGCGDSGGAVAGKPATSSSPGSSDNPFEGKSGSDVQRIVVEGMKDVDSLRMSADVVQNGASMALVFLMDRDGNCEGSIQQSGARADIKSDGVWSYMRGDEAFWTEVTGSPSDAGLMMSLLDGKWVRIPADDPDGFTDVCDLDGLLGEFNVDGSGTELTVGGASTVDGVEVIELTEVELYSDEVTTIWVEAAAPHRIVRMKMEGGDEPGEFAMSRYNEPLDLEMPGSGEFIDQDDLGR